jgi:mono/diheme cytochrome c family protein
MVWAVLAAMLLLASPAFAADNSLVTFSVHGKPVAQLSLADMEKKVPATRITVWEPIGDSIRRRSMSRTAFRARRTSRSAPSTLSGTTFAHRSYAPRAANAWAYQIVGVDLVTFADRFPRLSPPKDASNKAKRGFLAFRENCMSYHTINGEGGNKAPELNYPTSVTEYLSDAWMRKWLMDPRSIRYNTTMPAFASHSNSDTLVDDVLAYLKTMARHKQKPQ